MQVSQEQLESYYAENLWSQPGQHMLEIGPTGSGKTNGLIFNVDKLLTYSPHEKLVWFDTGKSAEMALLSLMKPLKIHIPKGCEVSIEEVPTNKYETFKPKITEWESPRKLWENIKETPLDYINVVSFEPFVVGGVSYVNALNDIFNNKEYSGGMLDLIKRYKLKGPIAVFMDELQDIAPAKVYELQPGHFAAGSKFQFFLDRMRSLEIRLFGASQGWPRLRAGVRSQFPWNMPRRGARYLRDSELHRYNPMWRKFKPNNAVIVNPNNEWPYNTKLELPFYGRGGDIWKVEYHGMFRRVKKNDRQQEEEDGFFKNSELLTEDEASA